MTPPAYASTRLHPALLIVLILSYLTGILSPRIPGVADWFRLLTPIHLTASLGLLLWFHTDWRPKLWDVPPIIGLNWLLLSYCCGSVCDRLPVPVYIKTVVAATTMVLLDVLIEPTAIRLDFWTWFGQPVPLQNYFGWWLISLALLGIWYGLPFRKQNPLAGWLLGLQFFFFLGHTLFNIV